MNSRNEVFPNKIYNTNDLTSSNQIQSSKQRPEVIKIRERALVIIGILLGLYLHNFVVTIITYTTKKPADGTQDNYRLISALFSIVYYGFGFFVARRYSRIGLLVFAWLGLLFLLALAVIIFIIVLTMISTINLANGGVSNSIIVVIIVIIICLLASLLQIFAIRYALLLSKLLEDIKPLPTEQI